MWRVAASRSRERFCHEQSVVRADVSGQEPSSLTPGRRRTQRGGPADKCEAVAGSWTAGMCPLASRTKRSTCGASELDSPSPQAGPFSRAACTSTRTPDFALDAVRPLSQGSRRTCVATNEREPWHTPRGQRQWAPIRSSIRRARITANRLRRRGARRRRSRRPAARTPWAGPQCPRCAQHRARARSAWAPALPRRTSR